MIKLFDVAPPAGVGVPIVGDVLALDAPVAVGAGFPAPVGEFPTPVGEPPAPVAVAPAPVAPPAPGTAGKPPVVGAAGC